jgi:subtilisin family serine protease
MKKLLMCALICLQTLVFGQANHLSNELIVRFKNADALAAWQKNTASQRNSTGFSFKEVISKEMNLAVMTFDAEKIEFQTALANCRQLHSIENAYPNYIAETRERIPDDVLYPKQWHLPKIKAAEAWETTTGSVTANGDTIVIAVFDGGVEVTHEDLKENIWINHEEIANNGIDNDKNGYIDDLKGWNFTTNNDKHKPKDHATRIAGIMAASGNNAKGIVGVLWNAKIMAFSADRTSPSDMIKAYQYILEKRRAYNQSGGKKGAFVVAVSSSIGLSAPITIKDVPFWCEMFDKLGAEGILIAAATRNTNDDIDLALDVPTACPSNFLMSVTSSTPTDALAPNAAFGKTTIDLAAPGTQIFTTITNNKYAADDAGTLYAAPQVAAAVALVYANDCKALAGLALSRPTEAALWVKKAILESTDRVAALSEITVTGGRLNLAKTIAIASSRCALLTPTFERADAKPYTIIYGSNGVQVSFLEEIPQSITLYNIQGKIIQYNLGTKTWRIDIGTLNTGIYIATIRTAKGIFTEKIAIQ